MPADIAPMRVVRACGHRSSPASNVSACCPWSVTMSSILASSSQCASTEMIGLFEWPVECTGATSTRSVASATDTTELAGD